MLGVDANHLTKLNLVLPTWIQNKPHLRDVPWRVFVDGDSVNSINADELLKNLLVFKDLRIIRWDPDHDFPRGTGRWYDPQRQKMLAGFVHIPALEVETPYWLKLDLDVVASGVSDWIDPQWFENDPAIIGHRWGYTKPPHQMEELDNWVKYCQDRGELANLADTPPLDMHPKPDANSLPHKRIISWCAFFNTDFTRFVSESVNRTCNRFTNRPWGLPVPSQDGIMWYMATRMKKQIVRTNMKSRGWIHCSRESGIREEIAKLQLAGKLK